MPYQNLDSEIILAAAIWLLAIFVFLTTLLVVLAKMLSENLDKHEDKPGYALQVMGSLLQRAKQIFPRKKQS